MHHAFLLLPLFTFSIAAYPGNQARAEPEPQTVTETTTATVTLEPLTCEAVTYTITTAQTVAITVSPDTTTVTVISTPDAVTIVSTTIITTTVTQSSSVATNPNPPSTLSTSSTAACTPTPSTLSDGGFELSFPWLGQPLTTVKYLRVYNNAHSGDLALQISVTGRSSGGWLDLWQSIPLCAGTTYTLVAWVKTADLAASCVLSWHLRDMIVMESYPGTEYAMVTGTWVVPVLEYPPNLRVMMLCNGASGQKMVWVDDVSLEPVL